jgi:hypothetical protein
MTFLSTGGPILPCVINLLRYIFRPMKIDIMFLVPARMGFICRTKIFHYSLFLKNRLNKTPNSSPDQSLIAAFCKRNSNCIFLKILLASAPGMRRNILYSVDCSVGRIKLKWIIHQLLILQIFMGVFTGSRKLLTSRIQIQKIMKNEKIRSKFLKIVDEKHDFNFHWPYMERVLINTRV